MIPRYRSPPLVQDRVHWLHRDRQQVMASASGTLKRLALELGGQRPGDRAARRRPGDGRAAPALSRSVMGRRRHAAWPHQERAAVREGPRGAVRPGPAAGQVARRLIRPTRIPASAAASSRPSPRTDEGPLTTMPPTRRHFSARRLRSPPMKSTTMSWSVNTSEKSPCVKSCPSSRPSLLSQPSFSAPSTPDTWAPAFHPVPDDGSRVDQEAELGPPREASSGGVVMGVGPVRERTDPGRPSSTAGPEFLRLDQRATFTALVWV